MIKEDFGELDDIGFLREAELFRDMPESVIRTILSQAETQLFGADDVVVHKGDEGDRLFVVKSGVVEVATPAGDGPPLAYLGRGDCFGELALLTGSDRSNDIRVPQQAELLVIDRALFQDLMSNHAGFGGQLAIILAHRLVGLLEDLPERGHKRELQGDLRYFDLTTVVQTLITSAQTGVMTFTSNNETAAELHFQGGNIYRARFAHRRGDEAVHNLFQDQPQGEFRFESHEADEVNEGPDPGITVPAMALMMESVRLQDELKMLLEDLPTEGTRLQRNRDTLEWTGDEGQADARQLWGCLHQPVTLADLFARSHACRYHAARVLTRMLQTEQIRPSVA